MPCYSFGAIVTGSVSSFCESECFFKRAIYPAILFLTDLEGIVLFKSFLLLSKSDVKSLSPARSWRDARLIIVDFILPMLLL
jgi:hypothetical protein